MCVWQQLRHENLVSLLEVCKRRRRWYLVFEFVDRNLLDELELHPSGLEQNRCRAYLYQILRALNYCHQHNVRMFVLTRIIVSTISVSVCEQKVFSTFYNNALLISEHSHIYLLL